MEKEVTMPKVSVVIPVYGVEQYIERCARTLFEQTLDSIEYLFIDDCTPDKSIDVLKAVLEEYPDRKPQVVIHRMELNSGQAAVRKWGILNATGEYIIHCDSDDWVDVTIYEKLYNKAVSEKLDIVMCDYYLDNGCGERRYENCMSKDFKKEEMFQKALVQSVGASLWNKLVRRDLIPKDSIEFAPTNMGEDYVMVIQYLYYAKHIAIIKEPLYHYFLNENSITNSQSVEKVLYRFEQSISNMDSVERFMRNVGISEVYQNELDRLKYYKRNNILPIISDRKYYKLWKMTFSEINSRVLANPLFSFREKIKFFMIYLRIIRK